MLPESEWSTLIESALKRVCSWRVPPNWSSSEWMKEMRAHGASAIWQAVCEYDPSRGIPFSAYARQRVWASALTRYRQEWVYALRTEWEAEVFAEAVTLCDVDPSRIHEWLPHLVAELSAAERWLIEQLYWEGRTELEIANELGITQQAVSKRKSTILRGLRGSCDDGA